MLGGRPTAFTASSNRLFSGFEWNDGDQLIFADGFESADTSAWSTESKSSPGQHTKSGVTIIPADTNLPDPNLDCTVTIFNTGGSNSTAPPAGCSGRNYNTDNADVGTRACLEDERFAVTMDWDSGQGSGTGFVFQFSSNHALFIFQGDEALVRLIDGCTTNNNFWVYVAAPTFSEYTLRVTDTDTGQTRTYENSLGQAAQPVTDTSAFATCP